MLKKDTLKNGTSRLGLCRSAPPPCLKRTKINTEPIRTFIDYNCHLPKQFVTRSCSLVCKIVRFYTVKLMCKTFTMQYRNSPETCMYFRPGLFSRSPGPEGDHKPGCQKSGLPSHD